MASTTVNLGKIIPNFVGDWNSTATYSKMDVVIYSNNSYIALKSVSANVVPTTDTASWALLAKGVPGPKGDTGATGSANVGSATGVLPIANGGTGRTDGGAVALDSLPGVTSVLSFTLPTGLDGTMRTWQVTISNDTGTPDTQVYTGFLIGGSGSNIFRWILLHNITRQLYTATGNYTRTGDTYTVSSLDWAVTSDTKRPLPIVTADSSSTGVAYTVTNSTLPLSVISSKGYTFKFIPNVTSTSTGATLSINGMAPTKFGKVDSYTGSIIAVSDTNSAPGFLQQNTYTLTYTNGFFVIVDMSQPNAASLVGTVPIANGGTGRTDGVVGAGVTAVTITDFNLIQLPQSASSSVRGFPFTADSLSLNKPSSSVTGYRGFFTVYDANASNTIEFIALGNDNSLWTGRGTISVSNRLVTVTSITWKKVSDDSTVVHNAADETIAGKKIFTSNVQTPGVEISGAIPYVDFHFGNSVADYTTRIIENSAGILTVATPTGKGDFVTGRLITNGDGTLLSGNYGLRVTSSGFQKTTDGGTTWVTANI